MSNKVEATIHPKPVPPKPWISGHCNEANPPEIHAQCHGSYDGRPCKCTHHAAERFTSHVHGIRVSADATLTFDLDGLDWQDTVRIAHELKMAKGAIAAAEEFLAKHAGAVWPGKWRDEQTVDGIGRANPYKTKNTSWDSDDLVSEVVDKHLEAAAGELPSDPMSIIRWLTDAAHIDYWRIGKLKALGIEVDDFKHVTFGTTRLSIKSDDMVGQTTREETP